MSDFRGCAWVYASQDDFFDVMESLKGSKNRNCGGQD